MSRAAFRNVDVDPDAPVVTWPLEAIRAVLERGDIEDYRRIVQAIGREPWGPVAHRVEQVLDWTSPYGVARLLQHAIQRARQRWEQADRAWVRDQLLDLIERSGLGRGEFARRLGTSPSRMSTYLSGSVMPSAALLARARRVAGHHASTAIERSAT